MSNADEMEALADTLERARRGYMELSNLPHTSAVYTDYAEAIVAIRAGAVAFRQVAAVRELCAPDQNGSSPLFAKIVLVALSSAETVEVKQ